MKNFLKHITDAITKILQFRKHYFTKFNKIRFRADISLAEGFALFIVWFANNMQSKIAGFAFDYLVILYMAITTKCSALELNLYFIENYIDNPVYPELIMAETLFKSWIGNKAFLYIEPAELVGFVSDYFKGVNLRKFCIQ